MTRRKTTNEFTARYYRTQRARRKGPRKYRDPKPIKVRQRQHALSPAEYKAYIRSTDWARRKAAYFQTHGRSCIVCGTTQRIELHRMTYDRLGCEADDDLRPLCQRHHAAAHEHHRLFGGTLREATLRFITRMHETA